MSKLSDNIKTAITNQRVRSNYGDYSFVKTSPGLLTDFPKNDYKLRFTATFGTETCVSEEFTYNTEVLNLMLKDIKHKVVQEIFGEFRGPIHNIASQLYRREYDKAMGSLHELEKQMFNV
jgi:hypothetical protein